MKIKKSHIHIFSGIFILFVVLAAAFYFKGTEKQSLKADFSLGENQFGMRFAYADEDTGEYIRSQIEICYKEGSDTCYKQVSALFTAQFNYEKLLRAFEDTQNYKEVFSRCHQVVHFIGRTAYNSLPDIKTLYEHGSPACWGGFYHGVIEAYFGTSPYQSAEKFASEVRGVCGVEADYSTPRFFAECVHGIGHAMMFVSDGNLPKSLKWCDELPTTIEQNTCYGGVFMENSSSSTNTGSVHISRYLKTDDPLYPCNSLEERYLSTCYQYQSSYFAQLVHSDWKENANLCLQVPVPYQSGCFIIIGSNQVGFTQDPKIMNQSCEQMPDSNSQKSCIDGVVSGLMGRYINEPETVKEFCSIVEGKYRVDCWRSMGTSLTSWSTDKLSLAHFCEVDNVKYSTWCKEGLGSMPERPVILN